MDIIDVYLLHDTSQSIQPYMVYKERKMHKGLQNGLQSFSIKAVIFLIVYYFVVCFL